MKSVVYILSELPLQQTELISKRQKWFVPLYLPFQLPFD